MPTVWRIATEGHTCHANDMSGTGAANQGGRWNSPGRPMVYSSGSIALACIETLVHIKNSLPLNRYLVRIEIPQDIWDLREQLREPLPSGWDAEPAGITSISHGDRWLNARDTAVLEVPSVIIPEESNYLINPAHPEAVRITATNIRKWIYSPRLRKRL